MNLQALILTSVLGALPAVAWAWTSHTVDPSLTGEGVVTSTAFDGQPKRHQAYFEETLPGNGLLLITVGGTNSIPYDMNAFGTTGALYGYHVLGVDYPNSVVTTDCRGQDEQCFDRFRREIVLGEPVSELVKVDRANSLENRIEKLLQYMAREHAGEGWDAFIDQSGKPRWKRIVLAGHSQGSGHAAFLSKRFEVAGVILLAGPQDGDTWGIAPWVRAPGMTPADRYVGLLHAHDSFGVEFQLAVMKVLSGAPHVRPASYNGKTVSGNASTIVAVHPHENPHMSVIGAGYIPAWKALFERVTPVVSASK